MTWSQLIRKRGNNPQEFFEQLLEEQELFGQLNPESDNGQSDETSPSQSEGQSEEQAA